MDGQFPFPLPIFKQFDSVQFRLSVVFFVGESGSGKSTLIEAIAYGINTVAVGSENLETDNSLHHIRSFFSRLQFVKNQKPNGTGSIFNQARMFPNNPSIYFERAVGNYWK